MTTLETAQTEEMARQRHLETGPETRRRATAPATDRMAQAEAVRSSPDPLKATDRYRLARPYCRFDDLPS